MADLNYYLEATLSGDANATTFYHEILVAVFLAYPELKIKEEEDKSISYINKNINVVNNKITKAEKSLNSKQQKLSKEQSLPKNTISKAFNNQLQKEIDELTSALELLNNQLNDLNEQLQSKQVVHNRAKDIITKPSDIIQFIYPYPSAKVKPTATEDLAPIELSDGKMAFIDPKNDKENYKKFFYVAYDALHTAESIRRFANIKAPKVVYWTGPSNDSTKFGASDIVIPIDGIFQGISLKFETGQFKNLSTAQIIKTLGLADEEMDEKRFSVFTYEKHEKYWTNMLQGWYEQLDSWTKGKNSTYHAPAFREILKKVKQTCKTYPDYQKYKISDKEAETILKEILLFPDANIKLGIKDRSQIKDKIKKYTSFRYAARKIYQCLPQEMTKKWSSLEEEEDDANDIDFSKKDEGLRGKYFKKIIDSMFAGKITEDKLADLFVRQVSALDSMDLWYFAGGGNEYTVIPSKKTIKNSIKKNKIKLSYDISNSGSGVIFPIIVSIGKTSVLEIVIIFRFKQGQMDGMFETASIKKTEYKDWGKLLKGQISESNDIKQDILQKVYLENPLLSKMVNRAKEVSIEQHKEQKRKFNNAPYFNHPKKVAEIIAKNKKSKFLPHLISAAYLHDTIEDTNLSLKDIKSSFGELVASLVKELTNDNKAIKTIGKKRYLADKMSNMSSWALVIKLADRLDNVSDLEHVSYEFRKKYINETVFILKQIQEDRKLTNTQKKLVDDIYKNLYKFLKPL